MTKTIALWGPTAVGKTTLAGELAARLGQKVRHCGDAVRERATQLGLSPTDLPVEEHLRIDRETERGVAVGVYGIVDGRHLDLVLQHTANVLHVRVYCENTERAERIRIGGGRGSLADLLREDEADERLRRTLYGREEQGVAAIEIDTSGKSIAAATDELLRALEVFIDD